MTVEFIVTVSHQIAKGLAGGRVRVRSGESPVEAVYRRIARDTHCEIVAVKHEHTEVRRGQRPLAHYEITLRGHEAAGRAGQPSSAKIWVTF
jgi:hypothetical protein